MNAYLLTHRATGKDYIMTRRTLANVLSHMPREELLRKFKVGEVKVGYPDFYRGLFIRGCQPELL